MDQHQISTPVITAARPLGWAPGEGFHYYLQSCRYNHNILILIVPSGGTSHSFIYSYSDSLFQVRIIITHQLYINKSSIPPHTHSDKSTLIRATSAWQPESTSTVLTSLLDPNIISLTRRNPDQDGSVAWQGVVPSDHCTRAKEERRTGGTTCVSWCLVATGRARCIWCSLSLDRALRLLEGRWPCVAQLHYR